MVVGEVAGQEATDIGIGLVGRGAEGLGGELADQGRAQLPLHFEIIHHGHSLKRVGGCGESEYLIVGQGAESYSKGSLNQGQVDDYSTSLGWLAVQQGGKGLVYQTDLNIIHFNFG